MKISNPATGDLLDEVEEDDPASVAAVFAAARAAQPAWAARPLEERVEVARSFGRLLSENEDRLAATLTSEMGKPLSQARNELRGLGARIAFFADEAARVLADRVVLDQPEASLREVVAREPLGVVANISAWNYPWFVGGNVWVPALIAGNAVIFKPSEFVALTGRAVGELWQAAGVPDAVFSVVQGGAEVGAALLEADIDGVFFTGSYATGRSIATRVAGRMITTQLELGGKDPAYVAEDVDPRTAAVALADGAFYNTGQSCCSVERIYVHDSVYDDFVAHFVKEVGGFVVGDPTEEDTYIGPLTRAAQLDVLDDQVSDAVQGGARVLIGGGRVEGSGSYFRPTVLVDVDHTMKVMREESFGPVIGIQRVGGDEEALELANDTSYGLTAAIYTSDRDRAAKFLRGVRSGSAYWNCCDRVSPRLPWTGRGNSGIGATLGDEGIVAFTRLKALHLRG